MSNNNPYLNIDRQMVGDIYTSNEVMDNLTVLCDDFGSRFPGTPEERKAAEFIAESFDRYGLKNSHLEPYPYAGWRRGEATLEILRTDTEKNPLYLIALLSRSGSARRVDFSGLWDTCRF